MRWLLVLLVLSSPSAWAGKKGKKKKGEAPAVTAPAPVAPGKIALPCDWTSGTRFSYELVRMRTDTRQPLLAQVKTTTPLTITVTKAGNPLSLDYVVGETRFEGPPELVEAVQAALPEIPSPPMQLVLTDGALTDLVNHQAIVAASEPMLREMTAGAPPEAVEQTLQMLRDPVRGPALLMRDPARFFALHCVAMAEGEVLESPVEAPNPFGGAPLVNQSRVILTQHDDAADIVTFETHDALSPESLKHILAAAMQQFAPADSSQLDAILASLPPIESVTVGKMVYSTEDGFPVSVEIRQDTGAQDHPMHRSDTWIWTRTAP